MDQPNLFDFATSERAQDTFICWLASWADPAHKENDQALHATATPFLDFPRAGLFRPGRLFWAATR